MQQQYPFPVFSTQGGGLAKSDEDGGYVFVEAPPPALGLEVGDHVPHQWGVAPRNA